MPTSSCVHAQEVPQSQPFVDPPFLPTSLQSEPDVPACIQVLEQRLNKAGGCQIKAVVGASGTADGCCPRPLGQQPGARPAAFAMTHPDALGVLMQEMDAVRDRLNSSQAHALQLAMTHRVALIQGPPGARSVQRSTCGLPSRDQTFKQTCGQEGQKVSAKVLAPSTSKCTHRHRQDIHCGPAGGRTAAEVEPNDTHGQLHQPCPGPGKPRQQGLPPTMALC